MSRRDALTAAVEAVDLPKLILDFFPESKAKPGTAGVYFASWRGNTNTPALSVSRKGRVWLWSDKASGDGGNAFDFLIGPAGMGRHEAAEHLLALAGLADSGGRASDLGSMYRPVPKATSEAFGNAVMGAMKSMAGRGFNKKLLAEYRIIPAEDNPDDALIPITNPDGVIVQVKRRLAEKTDKGKYRYELSGYGAPPWCSSDIKRASTLFLIEGELNAIIAHATMKEAGEVGFGVSGMPGADTSVYDGICYGKHVFIYSDDDEAGRKAMDKWSEEARIQGARSVHRLPPHSMDFCDYAGKYGRPALAVLIDDMRRHAIQVFGALDRMVGSYSARTLLESAKRYISGTVINPTGFSAIDKQTGGVREAGLFGIAGLPSMGKSALMRRILLEQVRAGGVVRVYSPDQSPHAIYRLLASLLSGVGVQEARTRRFDRRVMEFYGDEVAALKAWQAIYTYVVLELSQKFQISEESEIREISKDMERAVDQGVTMFGVDFIQLLEPEGGDDRDGQAARQLQKLTMALGRPCIVGMQLAKYKFPPNRRNGLPTLGDIEGSGAYNQSCEMVFSVFNEEIYQRKYAGPEYEPLGDSPGVARILLRKDKEGDGDMEFWASWVSRLAAFKDVREQSIKEEQQGLV